MRQGYNVSNSGSFEREKTANVDAPARQDKHTSNASLYMATWDCRPVRLKSSSINSSETSAKYSWPRREQKLDIQDSGTPEEVDMVSLSWSSILLSRGNEYQLTRLGQGIALGSGVV